MENKLNIIQKLMKQYDGSFYIYDESIISRQIKNLLEKFPKFELLYTIKTNPFAPIVNFTTSNGFGADAASAEEVMIGHRAGLPCEKILYSTPGKTRKDIEKTIDKAMIVADSYNELILINEIAKQKNIHIKAGLRININYSMEGGKCSSSKFGVDEETLINNKDFISTLSNVKIVGIHVHLTVQVLEHSKLYKYYEKVFELAMFCKEILGLEIEFINFGGGLGIVYSLENDTPLDINKLGDECEELIQRFKDKLKVRLYIETGRFVICEAGWYVTRIADIKESMGTKYLIVEKGLNGFMRPSIAELIETYAQEGTKLKASEPLFTVKDAFEFMIPEGDELSLEKVSIVGSLCTATDIMVKDALLPKAHIGNLVVVSNSGSYSYSLTPLLFSSHPLPLQFYLKTNGELCIH
jgi:diaminopimelate decarboxylase